MSQAASSGFLFCFLNKPASFAPLVVLPAPCRPTSITMVGGWEAILIFWFSLPMSAVSSSLTILTIICAGVRLSSTSVPTQRSVVFLMKSLTTL